MGCFPCSRSRGCPRRVEDQGASERRKARDGENGNRLYEAPKHTQMLIDGKEIDLGGVSEDGVPDGSKARRFTFAELVAATGNFRPDCFLGEGGFGKVYKGCLSDVGQEVAIKQLDPNGLQGTKEFIVEVTMLSMVDDPNLVKLIGFCAERDQKLLVYEYMPLRSLEAHLHDLPRNKKGLDWCTRMKIAAGAAKGLDFGVVLLELISGKKAFDPTKDTREQNLVAWARPLFRDRKKFVLMADPSLERRYPVRGLYQALAISAMCVHEQPSVRPAISEVVTALTYLASREYEYGRPARIPGNPSSSSMARKEGQVTAEDIADDIADDKDEGQNRGD
ncbi:hypothetical protein MLD38_025236 [Melastoma candidum]|uniref:Uncharacterized protein n=1 Tax=Melastoma candidum TaxID=119954 RepID=A0ACB9NXM0_9MYRT|nr:hypothetical protein MLD38_025236 [Melastoma candidum]